MLDTEVLGARCRKIDGLAHIELGERLKCFLFQALGVDGAPCCNRGKHRVAPLGDVLTERNLVSSFHNGTRSVQGHPGRVVQIADGGSCGHGGVTVLL
jgi:hypothetical protein